MERPSETRFDPNFAAQLFLEIAHERSSLENLLQKFIARATEPPHMVGGQIWLIEKGDLCATCPRRPECADQTRCLHLTVAKGKSISEPGKGFARCDPRTTREPLGVPPLGIVALGAQQRAVADLHKQPLSPLDPEWMHEEQIRGYALNPIQYKGEPLGLMVSATRELFQEELMPWGRIFADHLGAAIANARAFQEIQRLKAQLELQNAYLQEAVIEAKAFGDLVGQSAALRQIVHQIDVVAPTEASVLILGETGSGKELVAHEIHRRNVVERAVILARGGALEFELTAPGQAEHQAGSSWRTDPTTAVWWSPTSSWKSNLSASNVTISCRHWKRPTGRLKDGKAPRSSWVSSPPHFSPGWRNGA